MKCISYITFHNLRIIIILSSRGGEKRTNGGEKRLDNIKPFKVTDGATESDVDFTAACGQSIRIRRYGNETHPVRLFGPRLPGKREKEEG